jgi:hypothetical protein
MLGNGMLLTRYEGVFLERIIGTPVHRILWNSPQSPLLLQPLPLPYIGRQSRDDDMLVWYIPLCDTLSISVAFIASEVLAIVSHTQSDNNYQVYAELGEYATWMHCPLAADEVILEAWSIFPS